MAMLKYMMAYTYALQSVSPFWNNVRALAVVLQLYNLATTHNDLWPTEW